MGTAMKLAEFDIAKIEVSTIQNGHVPKLGDMVEFKDSDGQVVVKYKHDRVRGRKLFGTAYINTRAVEGEVLVGYDANKCKHQRGHKETKVFKGLVSCFSKYFKDKNPSDLPSGTVLLAVPAGHSIYNAPYLVIIDGGHRMRGSLRAAKKRKIHEWFPIDCVVCSGLSEAELADEFVVANMVTPMAMNDQINAAVISGRLAPVWERFKDAEERDLAGKYRIVSSPEEHRSDNANTILFGDLLSLLMFGLAKKMSTSDVLDLGNEASQYAVDSWLRVYVMFCEIIGRKHIENGGHKNERQKLDCKVFLSCLVRMSLVMPMTKTKKPVYRKGSRLCIGLSKSNWRNIILSLNKNEGSGYLIREELRMLRSAGSGGCTDMWDVIVSKKLDVHGTNLNKVTPCSDFPRYFNTEMLHEGEKSALWV